MRADIHDGPEQMLQSKAGYIDARPLTANPTNLLATHGRTIHSGQKAKFRGDQSMSAFLSKANSLFMSTGPGSAFTSPRNERRAGLIGNHVHRRAVERFQPLSRQNLFDRSLGKALAVTQQISAVGGAQRMIGIMGGAEAATAGT